MSGSRCERCELIIGMGCGCPPDGSAPKARPAGRRTIQVWRTFPGHAILIKQNGKAHIPGACDHMTEDEVLPPRWGWIIDPPPALWGDIQESKPAIATGGNTGLRAVSRCQDCMGSLGNA
ncbi:hypothetical protein LXH09_08170 [Streptomyces sp. CS7]|uniref:hypothetical protein n=1 Tax=Streptomyces sp. CS-7 TaxID=2906769 RepID=UPI0021B1A13A|nr:hypothetical protein [Streptomyces sp. CS-7]MCT6776591.1 hypothetical protein [Streptomyces sp. CS-7]